LVEARWAKQRAVVAAGWRAPGQVAAAVRACACSMPRVLMVPWPCHRARRLRLADAGRADGALAGAAALRACVWPTPGALTVPWPCHRAQGLRLADAGRADGALAGAAALRASVCDAAR